MKIEVYICLIIFTEMKTEITKDKMKFLSKTALSNDWLFSSVNVATDSMCTHLDVILSVRNRQFNTLVECETKVTYSYRNDDDDFAKCFNTHIDTYRCFHLWDSCHKSVPYLIYWRFKCIFCLVGRRSTFEQSTKNRYATQNIVVFSGSCSSWMPFSWQFRDETFRFGQCVYLPFLLRFSFYPLSVRFKHFQIVQKGLCLCW